MPGRHPGEARFQLAEALHREMHRLEPGPAVPNTAQGFCQRLIERDRRRRDHEVDAGHVLDDALGDAEVSAVGDDREAIARDHNGRRRSEQSTQVRDVRQRRDQKCVESGLLQQPAKPGVARQTKSARARSASGRRLLIAIHDDRGEPGLQFRDRLFLTLTGRECGMRPRRRVAPRFRAGDAREAQTDRCRAPAAPPCRARSGPDWPERSPRESHGFGSVLPPSCSRSVSKSKRSSIDIGVASVCRRRAAATRRAEWSRRRAPGPDRDARVRAPSYRSVSASGNWP